MKLHQAVEQGKLLICSRGLPKSYYRYHLLCKALDGNHVGVALFLIRRGVEIDKNPEILKYIELYKPKNSPRLTPIHHCCCCRET